MKVIYKHGDEYEIFSRPQLVVLISVIFQDVTASLMWGLCAVCVKLYT